MSGTTYLVDMILIKSNDEKDLKIELIEYCCVKICFMMFMMYHLCLWVTHQPGGTRVLGPGLDTCFFLSKLLSFKFFEMIKTILILVAELKRHLTFPPFY